MIDGSVLSGELRLDADVVVIGAGAGGGMAFQEIARRGAKVVLLEEGPFFSNTSFTQREEQMIPLLFQESGGRMTADRAIRVLQGRGVGGSTLHNTNLCKRIPKEILTTWAEEHRVEGLSEPILASLYDEVEKELSVTKLQDGDLNRNNLLMKRGVEALSLRGGLLSHNRVGCQKSGYCELGCLYNAKENAHKILVPEGMRAGGTLVFSARVLRVEHKEGRVFGVRAVGIDAAGMKRGDIHVRARTVVVSASATGSASLLLESHIADPYERVGATLRLHPGCVVAGVFDEPVDGHRGIPQSYECTEYISFEPGSDRRVWLVPAFAHPVGTASLLPGFGASHMRRMRQYRYLAALSAMVHDETAGRVTSQGGKPRLHYELLESDRIQLAKGLMAGARILLAAGAKEVHFPSVVPRAARTERDLAALSTDFVRPHELPITSVHPMGAVSMGEDPRLSAVNSKGESHHVRGLFVADGSLFPTSLGVPPQLTIYALSKKIAQHVLERAAG